MWRIGQFFWIEGFGSPLYMQQGEERSTQCWWRRESVKFQWKDLYGRNSGPYFPASPSISWAGIFILDRRFHNQKNLERDSLEELSFDNQYLYHKDPAKIFLALDLGLQMRTWQRDCGDAPALQPTTAAAVDVSEPWGLGFGPFYEKIASQAGCFILA